MVADLKSTMELLREVKQSTALAACKWMWTCESIWDILSADLGTTISEEDLADFVALVCDEDKFSLARLVIPELREVQVSSQHPQLQRVSQQPLQHARRVLARQSQPVAETVVRSCVDMAQVIDATTQWRERWCRQESMTQSDFDDVLYTAEKRTFMDAEMQRARVLLHQSGAFGSESEQKIREWLASHPDMTPPKRERDALDTQPAGPSVRAEASAGS